MFVSEKCGGINSKTVIVLSCFAHYGSYLRSLTPVLCHYFESAIGSKASAGQSYCMVRQPWPHEESITVDDDVAFICLKK